MAWILWALAAGLGMFAALLVIGLAIARRGDVELVEDDYPFQDDFGASMARFGYVQDARNWGDQ